MVIRFKLILQISLRCFAQVNCALEGFTGKHGSYADSI